MEARTLQAFLRVLYTVNINPQYILAKSSSQVPAIVCSETDIQSATNEPVYARAPLKACLAAVCGSSPELFQDPARDFSLYVLDPLEAQPLPTSLAHAPHNTSLPRGVAVALGLMSWALESNDSMNVFVTGTIIPNASPALEVVLALRETKRMPKPILHSYPSLGPISAPGPSQHLNPPHPPHPPHPPQASGMSWLPTSHLQCNQQEQRTLTRSADFPELYIGPPRRAPGRPEGSSKSRFKSQASTLSLPGAGSSKVTETQSDSKQEIRRRFKQKTKSRSLRAPPAHSPFICSPLTRHTATWGPEAGAAGIPPPYQQSHMFSQNQTQPHAQLYPQTQPPSHSTHSSLLGSLSAIPSTSSGNTAAINAPEQQAALLSALQGLLATNPHLLQLAVTNMGLSANSGEQTSENKPMRRESNADDEHDDADSDSDIVILDSSTIDTTAFRKPGNRQPAASDHDLSPPTTNQESPMRGNQVTDSSPLPASTPPSGQEGTPTSSQTLTPTVIIPETETPASKHVSSGWTEKGNVPPSHASDIAATPTPSRTRKRKLGEYIQGQAHLSTPTSSPSPSPSVARTSSSGRALATKRVQSSPTGGAKLVSSPSVRLPSMLGSMRSMATSGSRLQVSSLGSSSHGHPAPLTIHKNENQTSTLVSGPSKSKADHPRVTDTSSNIASDTTPTKRRRTLNLNEFMAEFEARKNARVRKRPSSGRKLEVEVSANASQAGPSRSAKLVSTSRHGQSSPPRPLFRSDSMVSSLPASTCEPSLAAGVAFSDPPVTTSACTAPSKSTSTAVPTKNRSKKFVLPAWARTSTAMLPRLSEEVLARQRAEREAKKAQVSLRRREAAKAKRKQQLRGADFPSKESSDEDEAAVPNDPKPQTLHPSSSVAQSAPLLPPPFPSLPVFASDAVEPIPSSPPQSHRQLAPPVVPSTPPKKPVSSRSALHHTPSKSGSCSLFTPSSQDPGSLFTPSTPSVTRSITRVTFTPRSPTMLHCSGPGKSPWKSVPQTPRTPKRNNASYQTPRSSRSGRIPPFVSPKSVIRTPQMQTGMGMRAFLLPPPSPCTLRTPHLQNLMGSKVPGGPAPITLEDSGTMKQGSPSDKQNVKRDKGSKEEVLSCEPDDALLGEVSVAPAQCIPTPPTADDGQGTSELHDISYNGYASQAGEGYASSPLPPSSPLPASPFSSPTKHHDSNFDTLTINNLTVPNSDILLPSASDSDGPQAAVDATWHSDDACTTSWLTDSEASAWLTETEAWLTETEGGPLLTDSDGAWLSDSDGVFGNMLSPPPSTASKWLSDDADIDTDAEVGAMEGRDSAFDAAAFERAFATLVERGGRNVSKDEGGGSGATRGTRVVESEFWESMRSLLGGDTLDDAGTATGDVGDSIDEGLVAQDIQELLDDFVGT